MSEGIKDKVLFTGYYGARNTGDDVFCVVAAWGAKHYWRTRSVNFLTDTLPKLTVEARAVLRHEMFPDRHFPLESSFSILRRQTVIFAGGSLFHSPVRTVRRIIAMRCGKALGLLNLGAIGVSIGPFRNTQAEIEIAELLKQFSFLVLRDKVSYDIALSMKLPYVPREARDMALLLPKALSLSAAGSTRNERKSATVGISVCHYERYGYGSIEDENRREQRVFDTIALLCIRNPHVRLRFFVMNGHTIFGDDDATRMCIARLPHGVSCEVRAYTDDVAATLRGIGECDFFISVRLHGAILAAVARVPFVLVEYHRKCTDFLDDIQWPASMRIGDGYASPAEVVTIVEPFLAATKPFPVDMIPFEALAAKNFTWTQA